MQQPQRTPQPTADPQRPNLFTVPPSGTLQGVPQTGHDVQAIRILLDDLRRELQDAAERRNSIAGRLKEADPGARAGYQERLKVLDDRIIQFERDITHNNDLLGNAPRSALVESQQGMPFLPPEFGNNIGSEIVPIVAILSVFVLAPFTIAVSRFIWRRATPAPRAAVTDQATMQRLEQLQQSVDTIAIEVERISEGQRFVTRLLSDKDRALGVGHADPLHASLKSGIPSERG